MKRFLICIFILITILLIGCIGEKEEENRSIADGKECIVCGKDAIGLFGTDVRGVLYFCESCYNDWLEEIEKNDVPRINGDWTDPDNFGKVIR